MNLVQPIEHRQNDISLYKVPLFIPNDLSKSFIPHSKLSIKNVRRGMQQGVIALEIRNIVGMANSIKVTKLNCLILSDRFRGADRGLHIVGVGRDETKLSAWVRLYSSYIGKRAISRGTVKSSRHSFNPWHKRRVWHC